MRKSNHQNIRAVLREQTDGLTVAQLVLQLRLMVKDVNEESIRSSLVSMPDAYIDRWEGPNRGQYAAVWCVVVPPENCPKPTHKEKNNG